MIGAPSVARYATNQRAARIGTGERNERADAPPAPARLVGQILFCGA
jgi:hypothetical protein